MGGRNCRFIIATRRPDTIDAIRLSFMITREIQIVKTVDSVLSLLSNRRHDLIFIDINLLGGKASSADYVTLPIDPAEVRYIVDCTSSDMIMSIS